MEYLPDPIFALQDLSKEQIAILTIALISIFFHFYLGSYDPIFIGLFLIIIIWFRKEDLKNIDDLPEMQPTINDPYMNNIDSDVLKKLPKMNDEKTNKKRDAFSNYNYYKDIDSPESDRTFYTTPPDDQQAFMDFLNFGNHKNSDIRYEDLRSKRFIWPFSDN